MFVILLNETKDTECVFLLHHPCQHNPYFLLPTFIWKHLSILYTYTVERSNALGCTSWRPRDFPRDVPRDFPRDVPRAKTNFISKVSSHLLFLKYILIGQFVLAVNTSLSMMREYLEVCCALVCGYMLPPLEYAMLEFHTNIRTIGLIMLRRSRRSSIWMRRMRTRLMSKLHAGIICFPAAYCVYSCQPTHPNLSTTMSPAPPPRFSRPFLKWSTTTTMTTSTTTTPTTTTMSTTTATTTTTTTMQLNSTDGTDTQLKRNLSERTHVLQYDHLELSKSKSF